MYSPRSRWWRSARAVALLRWASRSLRQAMYSVEPAWTLLARQNASSSSLRLETGACWRAAQPDSASAAHARAIRWVETLGRMHKSRPQSRMLSLPGLTRQSIENKAASLIEDGCLGQARSSQVKAAHDGWSQPALQCVADLFQHLRILDGGGHRPRIAVGDLLDGAA